VVTPCQHKVTFTILVFPRLSFPHLFLCLPEEDQYSTEWPNALLLSVQYGYDSAMDRSCVDTSINSKPSQCVVGSCLLRGIRLVWTAEILSHECNTTQSTHLKTPEHSILYDISYRRLFRCFPFQLAVDILLIRHVGFGKVPSEAKPACSVGRIFFFFSLLKGAVSFATGTGLGRQAGVFLSQLQMAQGEADAMCPKRPPPPSPRSKVQGGIGLRANLACSCVLALF
jgi:hypothetical protein